MTGSLRARRDLTIEPSGEGWVVKDPVSLEYFRVGDRERFLLDQLREPRDINELTRNYRDRFPNDRVNAEQVLAFCASLRECSLLIGGSIDRPPSFAGWWPVLLSPLAIRLPGFDPTPLLGRIGWLGTLFSWRMIAVWIVAMAVVLVGLLASAEEVILELSRLVDLFRPEYAAAAILAVVLTKSWHELGHAVACRRMGAECHEVGLMLLAMTPCLYCDASDAWALPCRWRRAAVALGGVYFELLLATAAAAAWLLLAEGPLRVLAAYLVVIASASTVLVNLNPLVRFDGYYLLADVWGVSNLRQQSRDVLWGGIRRWVRGDRKASPREASPVLLGFYGAASTIYGVAILVVILWAIHAGLSRLGLRAIADGLVALTAVGLVVGAGRVAVGLFPWGPDPRRGRALFRSVLLLVLVVAGALGIASLEVDQTLRSPCRIENAVRAEVVAPVDGLLAAHCRYGDRVERGALIAELEDPAEELRGLELAEREATLEARIAALETRAQQAPELLSEIARLRPAFLEVRRQLVAHEADRGRRQLRAPLAGRVTRPAERPTPSPWADVSPEAVGWTGYPLVPENTGCLMSTGEPLCRVVGDSLQAVVLLDEHDSGLVRVGDPVRMILDREPGVTLTGRVEGVAMAAADDRVGELEKRLESGLRGPLDGRAVFRVVVSLDSPTDASQPGAIGRARVVTGRETLGELLVRWLRRLVRLG